MAVSKKAKDLYYALFDGTETFVANMILSYQERRDMKRHYPTKTMPKEFAKKYKEYWGRWVKVSPKWAWYYAARNGIEDVRYVPRDLCYTVIDQKLNARKLGWGFNDKNYYSRIFAGIKQPKTVIRNFGAGIFTDEDYNQITSDEALKLILEYDEVICKPTQESGSGRGIEFWRPSEQKEHIEKFLRDSENCDYIVQVIVKQHGALSAVHAGSLNTIRICSVLLDDGVHVLSSSLRMGVGDGRVDNVSAGGMCCGIRSGGMLDEYAYNCVTGDRVTVHPQGYVFKGGKVPSYDKAVELVMKAHPIIGHFRLVSWDIAIDEDGDALLIEANMRKGGVNVHQFPNGPLFGDLTERIMDEVFKK